ncbi:MAG: nucleoside hydrolase [Thermoguttaceae bacterium]
MPRILLALLLAHWLPLSSVAAVPVIYSTDLYHPHDDPDDHYDLATLLALPEVDVKCVIIDMVNIGQKRSYQEGGKQPGLVAVEQMERLAGRELPCVTGLERRLKSVDDPATDQPESTQGAVGRILSILRDSDEMVCLFTVGSLVDVAAAFNRQPGLFREKVRAIYVNAGTGPDGFQDEWNVRLDQNAYRRILLSDLPIEWYPCFGRDACFSHFVVDQAEVLGSAPAPLRAYFDYALSRSTEEPISYLSGEHSAPKGPRNMWCTASFVDLAGRKIYRTDKGYEALAEPPRHGAIAVECYRMQPVSLSVGQVPLVPAGPGVTASCLERHEDLIGKKAWDPDGEPDCFVRIDGLPADKAIAKAALTGPHNGVWLDRPNADRWLFKLEPENGHHRLIFGFWESGPHRLEIEFGDRATESITFDVRVPGSPLFRADLNAGRSQVRVIRKEEPQYTEVMSSVLKNLLPGACAAARR